MTEIIGVIYNDKMYVGEESRIELSSEKRNDWIVLKKPCLLREDGSLIKLEMFSLMIPDKVAIFLPTPKIISKYMTIFKKKKGAKIVHIDFKKGPKNKDDKYVS